jgi:hypothetical protein
MKKEKPAQSSSVRKGMFGRTIEKTKDASGTTRRTVSRTKKDGTDVLKSKTKAQYGDKKVTTKYKSLSKDVPGSEGNKNPLMAKKLVESKVKEKTSGQGLKKRQVYSGSSTFVESGYGRGAKTEYLKKKATEKTGLMGKRKAV